MSLNLNPFDVLGLKYDATWKDIKHAYKALIVRTHPDKMNGDTRYFMLVHDAYENLKKQFNIDNINRRRSSSAYTPNIDSYDQPIEMENYSQSRFNAFFEKNKISTCPYSHGYSNNMSSSLKYQEDIDVLKMNKVEKKTEELIIFTEPIGVSHNDNYYELGQYEYDK